MRTSRNLRKEAAAFHKGKLCKLVVCFVYFNVDLLRILHSIRLHVDPVQLPLYESSSVHVIVIHGFFFSLWNFSVLLFIGHQLKGEVCL